MDTAIQKRFAKRLRELRKKEKLTQERLAELSGIDYKHIQLLESLNPPAAKLDTLQKLAKAFGVTIAQLLDF